MELKFVRDYIGVFKEKCKSVRFEEKGISNIEALYLWAFIGKHRPDVVFESGVYSGRSTEIIACAVKYYGIKKHIAVDMSDLREEYTRKKMSKYNVEYIIADSSDVLESRNYSNERVFYFVDGPKRGKPFVRLFNLILGTKWVGVICHDCKKGSSTRKTLKKIYKSNRIGSFHILSPEESDDLKGLNEPYYEWFKETKGYKITEKDRKRMPSIGVWLKE